MLPFKRVRVGVRDMRLQWGLRLLRVGLFSFKLHVLRRSVQASVLPKQKGLRVIL